MNILFSNQILNSLEVDSFSYLLVLWNAVVRSCKAWVGVQLGMNECGDGPSYGSYGWMPHTGSSQQSSQNTLEVLYLMLQFFLKILPKSRAVGEDGKPKASLPTWQEDTPLSWACPAVAEGHLFSNFLFRFQCCSVSLSPFYLMGPYIKTCYLTLLFCYGTFKWESFSKPSCLAIKCVKSIS